MVYGGLKNLSEKYTVAVVFSTHALLISNDGETPVKTSFD